MTRLDSDACFIAEALPVFIAEAQEQLQSIEQLLLQLEDQPGDRELLDALFRCAHTIKGSAGIFGLDAVVAFTHHVETVLDRLRDGRIALDAALGTLLLRCNDQIRLLVEAASPGADGAGAAADEGLRRTLVDELRATAGESRAAEAVSLPRDGSGRRWHVSVHFGTDTFRNGMDPLAVLNYLRGLGEIPRLACDTEAVPLLDALDPESCHLGFEFALDSAATRETIESAFSFVRDDCRLHLIEPGAAPADFAALIGAMPDNPRLGDILVAVGAITRAQLQRALQAQCDASAGGAVAPPLGEILQAQSGLSPQVVSAALQKQRRQRDAVGGGAALAGSAPAGDDRRFLRVHAERLDAVIDLLGELVIAGAGALLLARQAGQGTLVEANLQIGRLIEEIRNGTLKLRMVAIGETFARFRRVVRDTAAELGKEVALEIVGADTELDKSVVERIADPLMHLVRNALDHGLEPADERLAAGKPAQGRLTLAAGHESGHVVIRIDDDGRGIHRDKVLARAWERGLVDPGVRPPDDEILQLIFAPGFSTAETVTNLSGRGVGMDVVRRNIEALRGSVAVSSTEGEGSRIEIRLPLTLAIIDGFLVAVGASKFIFPLETVVEVIEGDAAAAATASENGRHVVELRGHALPVVSLRSLYALESPPPARASIVVVQSGTARFGVVVDQLLGQHQTVIKPLSRLFGSLRGISGSTILGNGEVALIFDSHALAQFATERPRPAPLHAPASATQGAL